jgi:hypothetical protein
MRTLASSAAFPPAPPFARFALEVPLALAVLVTLFSPTARADEKEACVAASDQGQTLRDEGKLRAARTQMALCARDVCPSIVRRDCEKWLSDIDAMQPTVVLGARDPKGNDVTGTRVLLDGVVLAGRLDGKPIAIDPGEHTFRYEAPGAAPVEQRAVMRVGEKNRILTAVVMPLPLSASTAVAPPPSTPAEAEVPSSHAPLPVVSIALASVAVVAGASFAYFGLSGTSDVSHLRATCAPDCAQSDVDSARTKLIVSDVALGVGLVSLAGAAWFYFHRAPAAPPPQAAIQADVAPRPGGGVATLTARF